MSFFQSPEYRLWPKILTCVGEGSLKMAENPVLKRTCSIMNLNALDYLGDGNKNCTSETYDMERISSKMNMHLDSHQFGKEKNSNVLMAEVMEIEDLYSCNDRTASVSSGYKSNIESAMKAELDDIKTEIDSLKMLYNENLFPNKHFKKGDKGSVQDRQSSSRNRELGSSQVTDSNKSTVSNRSQNIVNRKISHTDLEEKSFVPVRSGSNVLLQKALNSNTIYENWEKSQLKGQLNQLKLQMQVRKISGKEIESRVKTAHHDGGDETNVVNASKKDLTFSERSIFKKGINSMNAKLNEEEYHPATNGVKRKPTKISTGKNISQQTTVSATNYTTSKLSSSIQRRNIQKSVPSNLNKIQDNLVKLAQSQAELHNHKIIGKEDTVPKVLSRTASLTKAVHNKAAINQMGNQRNFQSTAGINQSKIPIKKISTATNLNRSTAPHK